MVSPALLLGYEAEFLGSCDLATICSAGQWILDRIDHHNMTVRPQSGTYVIDFYSKTALILF
jgi:hypothetical protein